MNLVEIFSDFKDSRNIDRPTTLRVLEDVFLTLIKKKYGTDENFEVIVNTQKGDLELWRKRLVVPDGEIVDDRGQISLTEAQMIDEDNEVGDECYEKLELNEFGRRSIMAAKQTLMSRLMELEKDEVYKKYVDRVGDLVIGEVHQVLKKDLLIVDDATGSELLLPKEEMIRGDHYRKGELVKAVITSVEMINNNPSIRVSRTSPLFLERLLEQEVPEIEDDLIAIRQIERIPGDRAKVAVESYDERIDPVGACVGMKGSRIHGIVRELRNENIDIVNFTSNIVLYIQRSLTPAKVSSVVIDDDNKRANVYLDSDQVSLAIGKGGANIKLATRLTGYEINVQTIGQQNEYDIEDVDLIEFKDEIEEWVIRQLQSVGCDTAKSVLRLTAEELESRTDLEEETIKHVLEILAAEFEDED